MEAKGKPTPPSAPRASRTFTLADLQQACREAKAPIVQDTPYAQSVVKSVQEWRDLVATPESPRYRANIQREKRVLAAWGAIRSELALLNDPVRAWEAGGVGSGILIIPPQRLAEFERAMDDFEGFLFQPRRRRRGQHGESSTPPKWTLIPLARDLHLAISEARSGKVTSAAMHNVIAEAGRANVSYPDIHRVLSKVLNLTSDAIRKALPPGPRREKHQRGLKEQLGMAPADLGETCKRGPRPGKK